MKLSGYKEAGVQYEGFLIDNGIQEQVLQEFGFQGLLETEDYRAQCLQLKENDEEIANACVWLKYDVMRQGHLKVSQADVIQPAVILTPHVLKPTLRSATHLSIAHSCA